jgi:hypothetical protein
MKNLKDLFVSKEISVKLKEKGFNEPCMAVYRNNDLYFDTVMSGYASDISDFSSNESLNDNSNYWISAPLYSQVEEWIFKNHALLISHRAINKEEMFYSLFEFNEDGRNCLMNVSTIEKVVLEVLKLI